MNHNDIIPDIGAPTELGKTGSSWASILSPMAAGLNDKVCRCSGRYKTYSAARLLPCPQQRSHCMALETPCNFTARIEGFSFLILAASVTRSSWRSEMDYSATCLMTAHDPSLKLCVQCSMPDSRQALVWTHSTWRFGLLIVNQKPNSSFFPGKS